MKSNKKKGLAIMAIMLVCILLIVELPGVINASGLLRIVDQNKVDEAEQENIGKVEGKQPENEDTDVRGEEVAPDEQKTDEKKDVSKSSVRSAALSSEKEPKASSEQLTAQDITPVDDTDPMYWMGQRTGGDKNRAMVWFGDYWQDKEASKKTPVLWRTLRSDGEGNYGGSVTLMSEYGLNVVYFDKSSPINNHWCSTNNSIGSSDLRAWMNGVGTDAMDASASFSSRLSWSMPYNETGGGEGNIKGSFYANAFDDGEKRLILPTNLAGQMGYETGRTVRDKIFGLSYDSYGLEILDASDTLYFKDNEDRRCYGTKFVFNTNTISGRGAYIYGDRVSWWLRSPGYYSSNMATGCPAATGAAGHMQAIDNSTCGRPCVNVNPTDVLFTASSATGGEPPLQDKDSLIGISVSNGSASDADTTIGMAPVYTRGASYRIFARNNENSKLGISNGTRDGAIAVSYPAGSAGQYINALVVNDAGEKWTGRVKHIENNKEGTLEFFIPQRNPGSSVTQNVRVFAWRETEETKTACIPNYKNLSLTEAASYKITYDNGGGREGADAMGAQSVAQGASVALWPCTFKKTLYYFIGWKGSDGKMYSDEEVIVPTGDLTLTAVWSNSYKTITYKAGNGSGSDVAFNMGTGSKITIQESSFSPPGSASFIEWNTSADGSGTSFRPGDSITLNSSLTLYAVFGTKATITYDANGGDGDNLTQDGYLEKAFTLKSEGFKKTGYALSGWNTAADGSGTGYELGETVALTGNCTLYAQWAAIGYAISFDGNGSTSGDIPEDITPLTYGDEVTIPPSKLLRGKYVFEGWTADSSGAGTVYKEGDKIKVDEYFPDGSLTLYAKWVNAANYRISYNLNKPTSAADSDVEGTIPLDNLACYSDGINTRTTAAEPGVKIRGYQFKGWSPSALTPPLSTGLILPKTEVTPTADLSLFAIWASAAQWKVTYAGTTDGVAGRLPSDDNAYYDDGFEYEATVLSNPQTRTGYTFLGWSETRDSVTAEHTAGEKLSVTGNLTLYSVWEANDCTVKYDRNASGGSGSAPANQTGKYGTGFTVSDAPSDMKNPGFDFQGWNTKADGSGKSYTVGQNSQFPGDITLYAQWSNSQYQIVFDPNEADKGDTPDSLTPAYGDTIDIPDSNLCKKKYIFDGWAENSDGSGKSYAVDAQVKIDSSFHSGTTTLYAKWKAAEKYKLIYNTNGESDLVTGNLPEETSYDADGLSNVINVTNVVPVRKGYTFLGWSTAADGTAVYNSGQRITLNKDITLYAIWSEGTYALIYYFNGGADTQYGDLPKPVTGGPATTGITAAHRGDLRRAEHKFTGWNTEADGSGTSYAEDADIVLNENIDLYAQWQQVQQATLTYSKNCLNPETIMPSADKGHYDDGINYEATIAPDTPVRYGYTFMGWSKDPNGDPDSSGLLKGGDMITVTSDTTVYAIWKLGTYTLRYDKNVDASDDSQVQGSWPEGLDGNVNMSIKLHDGKGITRSHYTLKEWNTKADGSGNVYTLGAAFSLISDTTFYAIWEPVNYTIHYDSGADDVTGKVPDDQSGKYKTSYQAAQGSGMNRPGASFSGWNDQKNGSGNSYTPGATYQYEGNKTLYAQWSDSVWTIQFNTDSADQGDAIDDVTAGLNAMVKLPDGEGLKKARYSFEGWNTAPDGMSGTSYTAGGTLTIQDSMAKTIILYSKWKNAEQYKVTYDKNGDKVSGSVPGAVTCYNDKINHSTVIPADSLTRKGYTFAGWSDTKTGNAKYHAGDSIDMAKLGKDLALYAVWTQDSFQLMYDANAADINGNAPDAVTGNVDSNIKAADPGNMYLAKHKFLNWNTEADGSGASILPGAQITLDENKLLYAVWKPIEPVHITYYSDCDDSAVDPTLPSDTKDYYDDGMNSAGSISTIKPIRRGYEFSYWTTQPNGAGMRFDGGEDLKVTKDLTLYAVWDMGNYTLTYDANAKDVQGKMPPSQYGTLLSNIKAEDNSGFTLPYYTFKGWNTEKNGTGLTYQPGDSISLGRDLTLYAQWRETVYKVTYDLNSPVISEAQGTVPEGVKGTHLEKFTAAEQGNLACKKYKFTGWNTDPDGEGEQFEPGEEYQYKIFENYGEEVTLYANWVSVPPFEVVYHKNADDASGDVPVDSNLYIPDDGSNLATVLGPGSLKRRGYEFVCWTTKKDGSGSKYVAGSRFRVTAHTILYAQWTPGTYTLTYNKNGSDVTGKVPGSVRSSSQEDIRAAGQNTMKKKNYEFLGWSTKADASKATYKEGAKFKILEDTTVYAIWRKLINVSIEHTEGLEPMADSLQSVSQGSKLSDVKLPAVKDGYEIEGWIVNGQKVTNPKDYVLEKDAEVQAIVKKKPVDSGKKDPDKDASEDHDSGGNNGGGNDSGENNNSGGSGNAGNNPGGNGANSSSTGNNSGQIGGGSSLSGDRSREATKAKDASSKVVLGSSKPDKAGQSAPVKLSPGSKGSISGNNTLNTSSEGSENSIRAASSFAGLPWIKTFECKMHFFIIFCMLIWLLLIIYWHMHTNKNEEEEENKNEKPSLIFDSIIPMLPFGCCMIFYLLRSCPLDLVLIAVWLISAIIHLFLVKRSYTKRFQTGINR